MYGGSREKKSKPSRRSQQAIAAAVAAAAEEPAPPAISKRDKWLKGSKHKHRADSDDEDEFSSSAEFRRRGASWQPPAAGASGWHQLVGSRETTADSLFINWEELLGSRETLKRRLDTIAAVHGWEARSSRRSFLGGVAPSALIQSIRAEIKALEPAASDLDKADLILELQKKREQLEAMAEERDRLAEEMLQLQEDNFESRALLAGQSDELDTLRQLALEGGSAGVGGKGRGGKGGGAADTTANAAASSRPSSLVATNASSMHLSVFGATLSRGQLSEGRRVVESLERLKLPDESTMGERELACWHENKKTIVNSLKTLSSQIYSARARILYEIIQNADDCAFDEDDPEPRQLYLECSDEALIAFHNERGFQPKDLYAMCQVGESSKLAGSGKIGRKGIGFKSVFQISDQPVVLSPPFQFCFDTLERGIFGYIVPSWVDDPEEHVPARHRTLLRRLLGQEAGQEDRSSPVSNLGGSILRRLLGSNGRASPTVAATGTLLVCPLAARVKGLDLMRDVNFDGLALAFLKNLEKISFASSSSARAELDGGDEAASRSVATVATTTATTTTASATTAAAVSTTHEYRVERTSVFERGGDDEPTAGSFGGAVLKGISVVSHRLSQCTIIERVENAAGASTETRRHFRQHTYAIHQFNKSAASSSSSSTTATTATTTISLAFPVNDDLSPQRSTDGELIFAYLPVTAAGFGFAIHADFELVASRQDVSDAHSGNHVLLGRIPRLFVHAVLSDPVLGEDAFATYLPDIEAMRKDRSGGGRKWHTLASALHRETGAFMMIPTEDSSERVRRRHAVLRPKHLSRALVPNSLLRAVTASDKHFADAHAVTDMCLESCLHVCPVSIVLDCIRVVLERATRAEGGRAGGEDDAEDKARAHKKKGRREVAAAAAADNGAASLSDESLVEIWAYLVAEYASCVHQGEDGQTSLRLLVDALIGGMPSSATARSTSPPLRIFPVRGSLTLRLHSEHGVALCLGLTPALTEQGASVVRLAERVLPRLDVERLQGIEGIEDLMCFLRVRDATQAELEQQLQICFRFGLAVTADPQLWWDSFRYTVSLGYAHGLADFMPGQPVALPVADSRVVSSRDALRLNVSLPCLLGLRRKHSGGSKHALALPPSVASSWPARVRWELAIVQAFGVTFPKADAERIAAGSFGAELLDDVAEARSAGDAGALEALGALLEIYERRMGSLLPSLREAMESSEQPEELLLEARTQRSAEPIPYTAEALFGKAPALFSSSCSPKYVDELLAITSVALADACFHDTRNLLEEELGMLRLKEPSADSGEKEARHPEAPDDAGEGAEEAEEPHEEGDEDEVESSAGEDACDEATWRVLARLLGFQHQLDPIHCPRLLYTVLTPVLVDLENGSAKAPLTSRVLPFITKLARVALVGGSDGACSGSALHFTKEVWPQICGCGGIWLGSAFVPLERCIWTSPQSSDALIWQTLQRVGCEKGQIIAIEPALCAMLGADIEMEDGLDLLNAAGSCCRFGTADRQVHGGRTSSPLAVLSSALPHPTDLEMMLHSVLPWLLEREGVTHGHPDAPHQDCEDSYANITGDPSAHQWSAQVLACYSAVLAYAADGKLPRSKRLEIPVPSAQMTLRKIAVDRNLNKWLAQESATLVVLPDSRRWPLATAFVLSHFGEHCLHPALVELFAPISERQSVAVESPRERIQRTFKRCLRLAAADADIQAGEGIGGGSDSVWALMSEIYERPLEPSGGGSSSSSAAPSSAPIPDGFSQADNWELLLWAVITCATDWHRVQSAANFTTAEASRYHESLHRVRRLVPFVEVAADGTERWCFLSDRQLEVAAPLAADAPYLQAAGAAIEPPAAAGRPSGAAAASSSPAVLLLGTLCGFDLWGNLDGIQLRERTPTCTAILPSHLLGSCLAPLPQRARLAASVSSSAHAASVPPLQRACFPEAFERASVVLMWEWFLLEIVGAAPPAVLWATVQEPIAPLVRPRIRTAMASLRQAHSGSPASEYRRPSLEMALLEAVEEQTQAARLLDDMDAADEARRAAAAREAQTRRAAHEARRREEVVARQQLQQARERERVQRERERDQERQQQRILEDVLRERERQPEQPQQPQQARANAGQPPPAPSAQQRPWRQLSMAEQLRRPGEPLPDNESIAEQLRRAQEELRRAAEEDRREREMVDTINDGEAFFGVSNTLRRMFAGGNPVVRRQAPVMRDAEVKAKLARFLAGMRALGRQQATGGGGGGVQQPLPSLLSEFIVWAGDLLAGEVGGSGGGGGGVAAEGSGGGGGGTDGGGGAGDGGASRPAGTRLGGTMSRAASLEAAARRYVGGSSGRSGQRAAAAGGSSNMSGESADAIPQEEEDCCCICQEGLTEAGACEELGEPLETACGHRFHAVCYARLMETNRTEQDPVCPMCRSSQLSVRFLPTCPR